MLPHRETRTLRSVWGTEATSINARLYAPAAPGEGGLPSAISRARSDSLPFRFCKALPTYARLELNEGTLSTVFNVGSGRRLRLLGCNAPREKRAADGNTEPSKARVRRRARPNPWVSPSKGEAKARRRLLVRSNRKPSVAEVRSNHADGQGPKPPGVRGRERHLPPTRVAPPEPAPHAIPSFRLGYGICAR
jgi:hypothetical protein